MYSDWSKGQFWPHPVDHNQKWHEASNYGWIYYRRAVFTNLMSAGNRAGEWKYRYNISKIFLHFFCAKALEQFFCANIVQNIIFAKIYTKQCNASGCLHKVLHCKHPVQVPVQHPVQIPSTSTCASTCASTQCKYPVQVPVQVPSGIALLCINIVSAQ